MGWKSAKNCYDMFYSASFCHASSQRLGGKFYLIRNTSAPAPTDSGANPRKLIKNGQPDKVHCPPIEERGAPGSF